MVLEVFLNGMHCRYPRFTYLQLGSVSSQLLKLKCLVRFLADFRFCYRFSFSKFMVLICFTVM